jgi:hypothetical protein
MGQIKCVLWFHCHPWWIFCGFRVNTLWFHCHPWWIFCGFRVFESGAIRNTMLICLSRRLVTSWTYSAYGVVTFLWVLSISTWCVWVGGITSHVFQCGLDKVAADGRSMISMYIDYGFDVLQYIQELVSLPQAWLKSSSLFVPLTTVKLR